MGSYTDLANDLRLCLDSYFVTSKDNTPELSIILLTRNNGRTIIDCLSSLLKQTYKNFELIILDNNSSDGTEDVIHLLTCDSRIKYFNCKKQGLNFNVNEALRQINTNKVLVIKPSDILNEGDLEFLMQSNNIKEIPHINYYPRWTFKVKKLKDVLCIFKKEYWR